MSVHIVVGAGPIGSANPLALAQTGGDLLAPSPRGDAPAPTGPPPSVPTFGSPASDELLSRLAGWTMAASGLANVAFWAMAWKVGSFVDGSHALDPLWAPAQTLHVVAAVSGALGLVALCGALRARLGVAGLISFVIALVGAMCYFTDGVIALVVYPVLAREAPDLLGPTGAMNVPPMLLAYIAFSAIAMLGLVALCGVLLRQRALPSGSLILFAVGAVSSNLPPGPVPVSVIQLGGVVFGFGAIWIGLAAVRAGSRPRAHLSGSRSMSG